MKLGIMQPYFFPYIGYFQLIKAVDKFILLDYLQYIKRGWINRNRIGIINQFDYFICVPLKKFSFNSTIKDVYIDNTQKWQSKIINLIFYNYKKSPYFEEIYPVLEDILMREYERISELNFNSIYSITSLLNIDTEIIYDKSKYFPIEEKLNPDSLHKKTERIIKLCQMERADYYINAINGTTLYQKEDFKKHKIDLLFLKTKSITYKQHTKEFIPNLSIIDTLFNCGIDKTKSLLDCFELI